MKRTTTNGFAFAKTISFFLLLIVASFGCQKELIEHAAQTPVAQFDGINGIQRPIAQCGTSTFSNVIAGPTNLGTAEILNSSDKLYVIMDMNAYKFIDQIKIYVGDRGLMPLNADGDALTEAFAYQYQLAVPANDYTFSLPLTAIAACNDIVIWTRVKTRNVFGNVISTTDAWMSGTPIANGYSVRYCVTACVSGNTGPASVQ
jgi:hypothetical protein